MVRPANRKKSVMLLGIVGLFLLLLIVIVTAEAAVPRLINYQGLLTNSAGTAVPDSTYNITFSLYTSPSDTAKVWTETQSVSTNAGIFSVALGSLSSGITASFDVPYYLGVQVASDPEMTPRQQLNSAAYAITADSALTVSDPNIVYKNIDQTISGLTTFNTSTGTVPFAVNPTLTGLVPSLNADMVDGQHGPFVASGQPNSVTSSMIGSGTVGGSNIAAGSIDSSHILAGSIIDSHINAGASIADTKLATISAAGKVADTALSSKVVREDNSNTISGSKTFSSQIISTVTGTTAPMSVLSAAKVTNLNADTVDGLHATDFVTQGQAGSITGSMITAGTITGGNIAAGTITSANIAAGTVTGANIAGNTITNGNISASAAISDTKIAGSGTKVTNLNADLLDGLDSTTFATAANLSSTQTSLASHTANVSNPHSTTAAQVGAVATTGGSMSGTLSINRTADAVDGVDIILTGTGNYGLYSYLTGTSTYGVVGYANGANSFGVYGGAAGTNAYAGYFNGKLYGTTIYGDGSNITNIGGANIAAGSIADTKLATISTAGKVSNTATTASASNIGNAIVARDASGNISVSTINSGGINATGLVTAPANGLAVGTNQLVVSGGHVGIGIALPNEQLEITENFRLPATTATTGIIRSGTNTLLHTYGFNNFFAGVGAGNLTMTGSYNTGVGALVLPAETSGNYNTALGYVAMNKNTTGNVNSAVGVYALYNNTSGGYNVGFGNETLYANTSGGYNAAVGSYALYSNSTSSYNTAMGYSSLRFNTTAGKNTALGAYSLYVQSFANAGVNWDSNNTAIGYYALRANQPVAADTGIQNTAVGSMALAANQTGFNNTAVGYTALDSNTIGTTNSAFGVGALSGNLAGNNNIAVGVNALLANTSGSSNVAMGVQALYSNLTGGYNTANGGNALYSNLGSANTANGYNALYANTGNYNTAVGYSALPGNTSGGYNIGIGINAGYNQTTGSENIYIGDGVPGVAGESGVIRIGYSAYTNAGTYITGIYGKTASAGVAVYVNSSHQLGTATSSRRFKEDIEDMGDQTDGLMKLRPVMFHYKKAYDDGSRLLQYGLIAEEVAEVYPDLVQYDEDGSVNTVRYQFVNAMLLNEVQKQHRTIEAQKTQITSLEERISRLEALISGK